MVKTNKSRSFNLSTVTRPLLIFFVTILVLLIGIVAFFRVSVYFRETNSYSEYGGVYIPTDDINLHVHERGKQNKQTIVFIHGLGSWGKIWNETTLRLEGEGFHTLAIDIPPFGFSEKPLDFSYSAHDQVKRLAKLVETLDLKDIILVGHSYGGEVTIETARINKDRIKTLILVDTGIDLPSSPTPTTSPISSLMNISFFRDSLTATLTHPWFTKSLLTRFIHDKNDATPDKVSMIQEQFTVKDTSKTLSNLLYSLSTPQAIRNIDYRELTFPTFIIWGEKDVITPLEQGEYLKSIFPNSKLIIMPGVGHIPQIEDNEAFNEVLLNLISS